MTGRPSLSHRETSPSLPLRTASSRSQPRTTPGRRLGCASLVFPTRSYGLWSTAIFETRELHIPPRHRVRPTPTSDDERHVANRSHRQSSRKYSPAVVLLQTIPLLSQPPMMPGTSGCRRAGGQGVQVVNSEEPRSCPAYAKPAPCLVLPDTSQLVGAGSPTRQCTRPAVTVCSSPTTAVSTDSHGWCAPRGSSLAHAGAHPGARQRNGAW